MKRRQISGAGTFALLLATATSLQAALVLEHDFRTYGNVPIIGGNGATASYVTPGGSPYVGPRNGASVNTGTALGPGFAPTVADGYVALQPNGDIYADPDDSGMISENTTPTDHLWPAFMGENRFNHGSVAVVIRPSFDGIEEARHTFFWMGNNNTSSNLLWLLNDDDQGGPALRTGNTILASLDDFSWDSDTWYLLAASWRDSAEAGGAINTLYIRPLSPAGVATSISSSINALDGGANVDQYLSLGRRADSLEESASSDMALFQLYNNYLSVDDFNSLHASLVPEPGSLTLCAIGLAFCCAIRRRRTG